MESLKNLWTNFWYWLRPQLLNLMNSVAAEVMRIALEEVGKLMDSALSDAEKQTQAVSAIRSRLKALGITAGTNLINQAVEQAVGLLKR